MKDGPTLDADGHVLEPRGMWRDYIAPRFRDDAPCVRRVDAQRELLFAAGKPLSPYSVTPLGALGVGEVGDYDQNRAGGFDPKARLPDMDAEGIDRVVLYPTLGLFMGGVADADLAAAIAAAYNDWLADYCAAAPDRLFGAAMLPLQDIERSVAEVRRIGRRACFRAVFVRPNPYAGRALHTRRYDPLWAALADHDLAVGVHEGAVGNMETAGAARYGDNIFFNHVVAHGIEMQLAVLSIVCGGVMERFPALRFAFLEAGGGWLAGWLERMDHHFDGIYGRFVPWLRARPSEYFRRQGWISFEPDERTLVPLAGLIGPERIVWGSDYPHADATAGIVGILRDRLAPLPERDRDRILHRNASELYGLGP